MENKNLSTYKINGQTKIIADGSSLSGGYVFNGCNRLLSVEIPNSVTKIGDYAFYECESLTSVEIPNSVTKIGEYVFTGCYVNYLGSIAEWAQIEIAGYSDYTTGPAENLHINGELVTEIKFDTSITKISANAFRGCKSITSVEISNSVTNIGDYAFSGCSSLNSVEIPNSVTSIGSCAFLGCESLTSINFKGTIAEWKNISLHKDWRGYGQSLLTKVICSDGDVLL